MEKPLLRQYIRKTLLEVLDFFEEEDILQSMMHMNWDKNAIRTKGLQTKGMILDDREVMKQFHTEVEPRLTRTFRAGKISVLHSIEYTGFAARTGTKRKGGTSETPFTDWIKKYGTTGRDMLSCVAWPKKIGQPPPMKTRSPVSNVNITTRQVGFFMKGYPAFISMVDVMSQTLGELPDVLVQHQAGSGIAKRAGSMDWAITSVSDFKEKGYADEVLLDNWGILACYVYIEDFEDIDLVYPLLKDALDTGYPVYLSNKYELKSITYRDIRWYIRN